MDAAAVAAEGSAGFTGGRMYISWPNASHDELRQAAAISVLLQDDTRLLKFLFEEKQPRLRKRAGVLRDDAWNLSEEKQLLIRASLDIWSGSGHLALWEMLETWDNEAWVRFLRAICELRGIKYEEIRAIERNPHF